MMVLTETSLWRRFLLGIGSSSVLSQLYKYVYINMTKWRKETFVDSFILEVNGEKPIIN